MRGFFGSSKPNCYFYFNCPNLRCCAWTRASANVGWLPAPQDPLIAKRRESRSLRRFLRDARTPQRQETQLDRPESISVLRKTCWGVVPPRSKRRLGPPRPSSTRQKSAPGADPSRELSPQEFRSVSRQVSATSIKPTPFASLGNYFLDALVSLQQECR